MLKYLRFFIYTSCVLITLHDSCHAQSPIEELTQQQSASGSKMHSRSFSGTESQNTTPSRPDITDEKTQNDQGLDTQQSEQKETVPKSTKNSDPDEKIWRKYKKIAKSDPEDSSTTSSKNAETQTRKSKTFATPEEKRISFNDDSTLSKDTENKDEDEETINNEESDEQEEEQKNGLSQALDGYLDKTERNTKMGRRSFGNPEDRNKEKKASEKPNDKDTKKEKQETHYQE